MYSVYIVCISILAVALQHGMRLWSNMGYWKHVHNHAPGPCKVVQGIKDGSEDIQALPNGLAFISSGGVRFIRRNKKGIFLFDFNKPEHAPTRLEIEVGDDDEFSPSEFVPHGMTIWQTEGVTFLYVINHHSVGDCVEKFRFDQERLKLIHQNTFMDSTMKLMNDLVATDEDKFYYTNSFYHPDDASLWIEFYLMLPWGNIGYFNGKVGRVVTPGLYYPNGINVSKDKKFLYLGMYGTQELRIYAIENNKDLYPLQTKQLYTHVDNIDVAEDGSLWLGGAPILHQGIDHCLYGKSRAASQILRVVLDDEHNVQQVTEVYANNGSDVSHASIAVYRNGKMLIGSVRDRTLLCDVRTLE